MAATQPLYCDMRHWKWSDTEKKIARKAFNLVLQKELKDTIREAKARAARIQQPSELWDLENYLTQRRKQIDRKYDYRYSVLPIVFGNLMREERLTEKDLAGLSEEKLDYIRREANL